MNRHRQRVIALTVTGVLVAALGTAGGWWLAQQSEELPAASGGSAVTSTIPTPTPTSTSTSTAATTVPTPTSRVPAGVWRRLPPAPLPAGPSDYYAGVWTGKELLIHGLYQEMKNGVPQEGRSVGAAYDPATRTWRRLPAAPGSFEVREGHYRAVWTGKELLGWGLGFEAAYNPTTNRWRRLSGTIGSPSIVAWTGRQVLTWGGGCCGDDEATGAAYTPATDSWQPIPTGPLAGRHTTGAWTGKELVIAGGSDTHGPIFRDAAAYNPTTRTWRRLPSMPEARAGATATWTGTEVLVVGGSGRSGVFADGVAYNPATNRWRRLPSSQTYRTGHAAVWTGHQLLVWGGSEHRSGSWANPPHGVIYDQATNRWSAMPRSVLRGRSHPIAVWTGRQMLVWGGTSLPDGGNFRDGAAYRPYQR